MKRQHIIAIVVVGAALWLMLGVLALRTWRGPDSAATPAASEADVRRALARNPRDPKLHNEMGLVLLANGRVDEAIQHFMESLRFNPANAEAHNNLGLALARKGRNAEAIEHFRMALRLKPNYPEASKNLADTLAQGSQQTPSSSGDAPR